MRGNELLCRPPAQAAGGQVVPAWLKPAGSAWEDIAGEWTPESELATWGISLYHFNHSSGETSPEAENTNVISMDGEWSEASIYETVRASSSAFSGLLPKSVVYWDNIGFVYLLNSGTALLKWHGMQQDIDYLLTADYTGTTDLPLYSDNEKLVLPGAWKKVGRYFMIDTAGNVYVSRYLNTEDVASRRMIKVGNRPYKSAASFYSTHKVAYLLLAEDGTVDVYDPERILVSNIPELVSSSVTDFSVPVPMDEFSGVACQDVLIPNDSTVVLLGENGEIHLINKRFSNFRDYFDTYFKALSDINTHSDYGAFSAISRDDRVVVFDKCAIPYIPNNLIATYLYSYQIGIGRWGGTFITAARELPQAVVPVESVRFAVVIWSGHPYLDLTEGGLRIAVWVYPFNATNRRGAITHTGRANVSLEEGVNGTSIIHISRPDSAPVGAGTVTFTTEDGGHSCSVRYVDVDGGISEPEPDPDPNPPTPPTPPRAAYNTTFGNNNLFNMKKNKGLFNPVSITPYPKNMTSCKVSRMTVEGAPEKIQGSVIKEDSKVVGVYVNTGSSTGTALIVFEWEEPGTTENDVCMAFFTLVIEEDGI